MPTRRQPARQGAARPDDRAADRGPSPREVEEGRRLVALIAADHPDVATMRAVYARWTDDDPRLDRTLRAMVAYMADPNPPESGPAWDELRAAQDDLKAHLDALVALCATGDCTPASHAAVLAACWPARAFRDGAASIEALATYGQALAHDQIARERLAAGLADAGRDR